MAKKEIIYNKCPICGKKESLYKKIYYINGEVLMSPNKFWLCEDCYNIEVNKKFYLVDGECFEWIKVWSPKLFGFI